MLSPIFVFVVLPLVLAAYAAGFWLMSGMPDLRSTLAVAAGGAVVTIWLVPLPIFSLDPGEPLMIAGVLAVIGFWCGTANWLLSRLLGAFGPARWLIGAIAFMVPLVLIV